MAIAIPGAPTCLRNVSARVSKSGGGAAMETAQIERGMANRKCFKACSQPSRLFWSLAQAMID